MKFISKSKRELVSKRLLNLLEHTHLSLALLNNDLEFEFGRSILNEKIGRTKNDDKFYLTLKDRFGQIIENIINESLNLVSDLDINDNNFRDDLDEILQNSNIFDGEFNSWSGVSPDIESMELETGQKNWWSRKK